MAAALVQTVQGNSGGYVQTFTKAITPTAGNFLTICWAAGSTDVLSLSDDKANTWNLALEQTLTGQRKMRVAYVFNCASGVTTITFSNTNFGDGAVIIQEWSGMPTTNNIEAAPVSVGGNTTAGTTYTITTDKTRFTNDLLLGGIACDKQAPAYTADAAWTNLLTQGGFDLFTSAATQYRLPTAAGVFTWTLTNATSQQASQVIVVFRSSASVAVATPLSSNFLLMGV